MQRSHTSSGTNPIFISSEKVLHPAQKPKADSKKAKIARTTSNVCAIDGISSNKKINAPVEKQTPIAWANCLGGPATNLLDFIILVVRIRVDSCPIGLKDGPVSILAQKPYARNIASGNHKVIIVPMVRRKTHAATERAAYSFTGCGKENIFDIV